MVAWSDLAYYLEYDSGADQSAMVMGFALLPASGGTYDSGLFLDFFSTANGRQFAVDWTAAGRIRILSAPGGSVLAESADAALSFDIYQFFEIKFTCHASNGTVQVRIDGLDVIAETTGLNLQQSGSGGVAKIRWRGPNEVANYIDDFYLLNQTSPAPVDFLGDIKVDVFWPTSDGNYAQFAPDAGANHYDAIDDNFANAVTHYIESDTVGQKDSFAITPAGDLPTIHAISVRSTSRNSDTGVAEGTLFIRQGGVDYEQASFERGDSIEQDDQMLLRRPDTGGMWTKAALEAMEFGFEFSAAS